MKKILSGLMCLTLLSSLMACSSPKTEKPKPVNSITAQDFMKTFDAMDTTDTITPTANVNTSEKNQSISAYILSNKYGKNLTHMSITVNKDTNLIVNISIFSEWDYLLKADGSKEKQDNLGFYVYINQVALALEPNIGVDKFEKAYTASFKDKYGGLGEEDKFTYFADSDDQFEHILFTLK